MNIKKKQPLKVYVDARLSRVDAKIKDEVKFNGGLYQIDGAGYMNSNPQITYFFLERLDD